MRSNEEEQDDSSLCFIILRDFQGDLVFSEKRRILPGRNGKEGGASQGETPQGQSVQIVPATSALIWALRRWSRMAMAAKAGWLSLIAS